MAATETIRVVYIGGWGRSGSTLLARALGQVPGYAYAGEVRELWRRGCVENQPCGCGERFADCEFWSRVGQEAFGGWDRLPISEVLGLRYAVDRGWTAPALLPERTRTRFDDRVARSRAFLGPLYRAMARVAGAGTILDSSKLPGHALLLRGVDGLDVRLVHLVRDSRGVAYSWRKVADRDPMGTSGPLLRYAAVSASTRYLYYNALIRRAGRGGRYLLVRYEDFVAEPRRVLERILRFSDGPPAPERLSFVRDAELLLTPDHTVDGNPVRFHVGPTRLRPDSEWETRLPRPDRIAVTALTYPMLRSYGYPTGSPRAAQRAGR